MTQTAASRKNANNQPHPTPSPLMLPPPSKKKGLKRIFDTQYVDTESSHLNFYTGKIGRNSQSTSSEKRAELEDIDTDSPNLIEGGQ